MPRERDHPKLGFLAPVQASLFPVFSAGLESVLEAASFSIKDLDAVGCGWQLLYLTVGHGADVEAGSTPRNGPHALLLLDPRPVPTFPYWEKVHAIQPRVGLTVLTPGYLWHETNPFRFDGDRVCIVVNFNVITNTYAELHRPMRF